MTSPMDVLAEFEQIAAARHTAAANDLAAKILTTRDYQDYLDLVRLYERGIEPMAIDVLKSQGHTAEIDRISEMRKAWQASPIQWEQADKATERKAA